MIKELTIIQDAYEKGDADRFMHNISPRGHHIPFLGGLCIRPPEEFKEKAKETLDRLINLKKILDAVCVEINQLKEKAALEKEMLTCQM